MENETFSRAGALIGCRKRLQCCASVCCVSVLREVRDVAPRKE